MVPNIPLHTYTIHFDVLTKLYLPLYFSNLLKIVYFSIIFLPKISYCKMERTYILKDIIKNNYLYIIINKFLTMNFKQKPTTEN